MNVAIACGGTGGHLFPGIAVAEVLQQRGHEVMLLVSEKEVDATAVRGRSEFRVERIPAIGLSRRFSPELPRFALKAVKGFWRCQRLYRHFRPEAVLGMGGFTSTAPILAGRLRGSPTFVHEANAIPGKANRLNARLAKRVLLGFEDCRRFFPHARVEVTGTPVRASLRTEVDRNAALRRFDLRTDHRTVLVMGGSQGAHGVNLATLGTLPRFAQRPVQFIHLAGPRDQNMVSEGYRDAGIPAFVGAFYDRMEEVYRAADLAISRAGAASLTELSYFGVPSVLIPYPYAAENHQFFNAEIFARQGAAEVIEEARVTKDTLGSLIDRLLADDARRKQMAARMRALAPQDSAERIARLIEASVK
ncbi:MAG: undecaprenyldiphospho-muramoylpentapeptide beta-N-acetylglucosaminyltransferase [Verrucomicrobia bacterium]|nr:undecaprenyldiphospho-muramoylpentapeptide beta-N-acetylglucosaminyltransferase [Verrucomicrobiota bacterium]